MIGDVVCPVSQPYKTKYIREFFSDTWPHYFEYTAVAEIEVSISVNEFKPKFTKKEFQDYMKSIDRSSIYTSEVTNKNRTFYKSQSN